MFERDYIIRIVKQLVQALAKILSLKQQQRYEDALETWDQALVDLFGPDAPLLGKLDATSAANMLVHPEKILAYAKMLNSQADLFTALGEHKLACKRSQRCLALLAIWGASRSGSWPADVNSLKQEAQTRIDEQHSIFTKKNNNG